LEKYFRLSAGDQLLISTFCTAPYLKIVGFLRFFHKANWQSSYS
jgi:hypothetical protein